MVNVLLIKSSMKDISGRITYKDLWGKKTFKKTRDFPCHMAKHTTKLPQ